MDLAKGYAVVDLEMTGPNHFTGLIIEIAVGVCLPGRDLMTDRVLVKIDRPLPTNIIRLTGITDRDLASGGITIDDALAWFAERTAGLPLVGHSILESDRPYLLEAAHKHRQAVEEGLYPNLSLDQEDLPLWRFIDTAGLYKGYKIGAYQKVGETHHDYARRVIAQPAYGLRTGLIAACEDLGVFTSRIRTHRAAGDVIQTHRLFEKLLELNPPE